MEDRISNLPDPILCHILSFLPTEEAIATSVLCKRWKPLWRSVPTLEFFCHSRFITTELFLQSVNVVILSRDQNQPIHKFQLTYNFCDSVDPVNFELWVNTTVKRSLQHLHLYLRFHSCLTRPANLSSIFSCTTLVVLKLYQINLELEFKTLPKLLRTDIQISEHTYFLLKVVNNAKVLYLEIDDDIDEVTDPYFSSMFHNLTNVELVYRYHINDWSQIVKLLQHCPMLQDLVIKQPECCVLDSVQGGEVGDWKFPPSVPECVLLHLKSCYLDDYRGTPDEFRFARYIMQNGRFLKRMTICSYVEFQKVLENGKETYQKDRFNCLKILFTINLDDKQQQ
ncbi:F-box/FBD/LRR-repeat protein At3g26920-like [Lotus japonicus]|uniref:F-box/FBD/LRR-repeat protein At3g26920-like n=1 Tax=Lotus japonicus TaxID=34305 RepID=UPI0025875E36|nr:F-box/FBD/LRR-repeat protein At3g26920-like [Lotus japonicus]